MLLSSHVAAMVMHGWLSMPPFRLLLLRHQWCGSLVSISSCEVTEAAATSAVESSAPRHHRDRRRPANRHAHERPVHPLDTTILGRHRAPGTTHDIALPDPIIGTRHCNVSADDAMRRQFWKTGGAELAVRRRQPAQPHGIAARRGFLFAQLELDVHLFLHGMVGVGKPRLRHCPQTVASIAYMTFAVALLILEAVTLPPASWRENRLRHIVGALAVIAVFHGAALRRRCNTKVKTKPNLGRHLKHDLGSTHPI